MHDDEDAGVRPSDPDLGADPSGHTGAGHGARPGVRRRVVLGAALAVLVLAVAGLAIGIAGSGHSDGDHDGAATATRSVAPRTGTTSDGSVAASTPTLDPADADLVAALRPFAATACHSAPRDGDGVVATVSCTPGSATAASAPQQLSVVRFASADALQSDLRRRSAGLAESGAGGCADGRSGVERWTHSSHRRGTFVCRVTPGHFTVYWTVDDSLVGFAAEQPDADQFMAWWRSYDPI
ncbi:hypothetical protein [Frankia sp. R82]|uniref:hypothetical protein n=1 Tax=Frankia sp. R82 TaxID=2950553 RepID=UPI002043529E|nr:hypothetical protein [Frankia sp. R82]MCM3887607.1 hypothetical protein [Frankia sp. R82]